MEIIETGIADLLILKPKVFEDDRGYFMESHNQNTLANHGIQNDFVQDNIAKSNYGVVRGLHFQVGDYAQAKLVYVILGSVLDVVVDLRPDSESYGQHFSIELSDNNKLQLLVPRGFAHGYSVLEDNTIFAYKCDNFYNREAERGIHPLDKGLDINWLIPPNEIILSEKDTKAPFFESFAL